MCGIYLTNQPFSEKIIRKKLNIIKYRGPDYQGYLKKNLISIGHNRLAIIDLDNRSNQPMEFKQYTIAFNGEIYNYLEVKKELESTGVNFETTSDTEVLLKGYATFGDKILELINGMFAFAIYDEIKNCVFIARDRLGVKPLYYKWDSKYLELCSQIGPIDTEAELDTESINIYLKTGYIPSPRSIYTDIKKLRPGTFAYFDLTKQIKTISNYWDLDKISPKKISYDTAKEELKELLIDAVKIRLKSDVNYGCFLSGGIDSAIVSSLASKIIKKPLNTFTIGFENKIFDESKIAYQFSNILGTKHRTTICSESDLLTLLEDFQKVYDEPFSDSSAIPSLLLNKKTKPFATVVLSGDGGDESFLGYNHFQWLKRVKLFFYIPHIFRYLFSLIIPFNLFGKRKNSIKNIFKMKDIKEFIYGIFYDFESIIINDNFKDDTYLKYMDLSQNPYQSTADLNLKLWLENDSNVKVDRASMLYSVEVRSPFLDYRIVEYARKLPVRFRYHRNKRKKILRDILGDFIPYDIFNKPKKGFSIPLAQWIRKDLREEISFYMTNEKLKKIPNLDIKKIKKMFELHITKNIDYSRYIWRVYVLSKWIDLKKSKNC